MSKLRAHSIAISLDGYAAGPHQSLDEPLGVGGRALHEWVFATAFGRAILRRTLLLRLRRVVVTATLVMDVLRDLLDRDAPVLREPEHSLRGDARR